MYGPAVEVLAKLEVLAKPYKCLRRSPARRFWTRVHDAHLSGRMEGERRGRRYEGEYVRDVKHGRGAHTHAHAHTRTRARTHART